MKNILSKDHVDMISSFCEACKIRDYSINTDGSVDVNQNVTQSFSQFIEFPFKFNVINGNFYWTKGRLLTLKNAPNVVQGTFNVDGNDLITLAGCPGIINGDFVISNNRDLKSLSVGEYDVDIKGSLYIENCDIPRELEYELEEDETREFADDVVGVRMCDDHRTRIFFKYQRHFEVWENGTKLNIESLKELISEINDGLE